MGLSMLGLDFGQWLLSEVVLVLMGVLGLPLPLSVLTSTSAVLQCCSGSTGADLMLVEVASGLSSRVLGLPGLVCWLLGVS